MKGDSPGTDHVFLGNATGEITEASLKHGADMETIREKLSQLGNTDYYFENIDIHVDENAFVPHGMLKQLRREAISELETNIIKFHYRQNIENENTENENIKWEKVCLRNIREEFADRSGMPCNMSCNTECFYDEPAYIYNNLHVSVLTYEQLSAVIKYDCVKAVYMDVCLFE